MYGCRYKRQWQATLSTRMRLFSASRRMSASPSKKYPPIEEWPEAVAHSRPFSRRPARSAAGRNHAGDAGGIQIVVDVAEQGLDVLAEIGHRDNRDDRDQTDEQAVLDQSRARLVLYKAPEHER